ncbi:very short patch repair endonuclease [Paenibacillus thailandensis]|jgi:DNA mismatch endonuclease (patch repair protein)|uniref:Very short patch repair endonuclease n=1 Tax=Paenibacillus thailandensis TaxID=393250 RepID=A0ABW5R074_9BACL
MADRITPDARSKIMSAVRATHTKLEDRITAELWKHGIRFRKNTLDLLGKPDIAIKKYKVVIFIDSCFWHSCELHGRIPKSNVDYWAKKLSSNKQRDIAVTSHYNDHHWNILRIWEHEIKSDFSGTIARIIDFINKSKAI